MEIINLKQATENTDRIEKLINREKTITPELKENVIQIIDNVKQDGDEALKKYTREFDKAVLTELKVSEQEIEEARGKIDSELNNIYTEAANHIRDFHEHQLEKTWKYQPREDVTLGQMITPISDVGVYVPGGKASYPSTVLMDIIPAKVAGVERVVMVTPPDENGKISPNILVAADIAGADEIYKVGGAQAVAALAYGTQSIKPVKKIVGPGNIFVALAKREVFGDVGIDMFAGPSEVLIIAEGNSVKPEFVAADLLAQAEHDEMAVPIAICYNEDFADQIKAEVDRQTQAEISRKDIARASIENNGLVIIAKDRDHAIELANKIAPEHLELLVTDTDKYLDGLKNAGAIFIGNYTPEPVGDYFAGPNHTLPTSGTAAFSSPLGVYDFQKRTSLLQYDKDSLKKEKDMIMRFAESEGLDAHANSIKQRYL